MTGCKNLIETYERNQWIILKQTEGLTHADSLLKLPFRANCLNWILGHIVVYRGKVLDLLGMEPVLTADEVAAYQRGSEPLVECEAALELERLLEAVAESQMRMLAGLAKLDEARLAELVGEEGDRTVGERLLFLQWHETYHVGQLEMLRQLAGKDDAII